MNRWLFIGLNLLLASCLWAGPIPTETETSHFPAWWFERDVVPRTDPLQSLPQYPADYPGKDDYAVLNLGQLKYLAVQAKAEMQARLPAAVWGTTQGAALLAAVNWTSPGDNDFAVVNQGQIKALAKLFYDALSEADYVSPDTYPWTSVTTDDDSYATVNLGQAKYLFSFDLTAPAGEIPDWWKHYYSLSLSISPTADADGDGLSNIAEFLGNTNPTNASDPYPSGATEIPDISNQVNLTVFTPFAED